MAFALVIIGAATPAVALYLPVTVPETFWYKGFRQAIAPVSAQFAVAFAALIAHGVEPYGWAAVPLIVGYLLSLVSSAWVAQILSISQDRERALMELQRSREQLALANHRAGAEVERARMNREVHDGVTQRLVVIRMLLEAAHHRFADGDNEAASHRCDLAYDQAMVGLKELRLLLASTSPDEAPYADGELRAAIENAVASVSAGTHVPVRLELNDIDVDPLLPLARRALLIRVLREALNNTIRHAGATSIRVRAGRVDNTMILTVEDDGVGLAPGTIPLRQSGHGFVLASMEQNLEACGGSFALQNVPTGSLRLTARIPLVIPRTGSLAHSGSTPAAAHDEALV